MSKGINIEILDNYRLYQQVKNSPKVIIVNEIVLKENKNHMVGKIHKSDMYNAFSENVKLIVTKSNREDKKYGFKIRCTDVSQKPFFRFDSAGSSHFNRNPSTPLALAKVDTPHFNFYDKDGYNTAYQTEELKNIDNKNAILDDINKGFSLFCREGRCITDNGKLPNIIEYNTNLFDSITIEDPLKDVSFK